MLEVCARKEHLSDAYVDNGDSIEQLRMEVKWNDIIWQ